MLAGPEGQGHDDTTGIKVLRACGKAAPASSDCFSLAFLLHVHQRFDTCEHPSPCSKLGHAVDPVNSDHTNVIVIDRFSLRKGEIYRRKTLLGSFGVVVEGRWSFSRGDRKEGFHCGINTCAEFLHTH